MSASGEAPPASRCAVRVNLSILRMGWCTSQTDLWQKVLVRWPYLDDTLSFQTRADCTMALGPAYQADHRSTIKWLGQLKINLVHTCMPNLAAPIKSHCTVNCCCLLSCQGEV